MSATLSLVVGTIIGGEYRWAVTYDNRPLVMSCESYGTVEEAVAAGREHLPKLGLEAEAERLAKRGRE